MTIVSTISAQGFSSSPRKSSFSQRFLPISTIAMKFTDSEEEEPLTPLGQDWQEDEYYQTANAFFSSSTVAALASSNARALLNGNKSAPITRNSSPEPAAACSVSLPISAQIPDSNRVRLVETLMHTVALAWDRYMALHQQSSSSTSFSDGDRSSPLPSFGLVVSDSDRSIVHVSAEFEMLTGYTRADSLGRSAAFLQGKLTSESAVTVLRSALKEKRPCQVLLINYKKDGQPFWNLLTIAPSFTTDGTVDRWFGIQMVANESWRIDRPMPLFAWTNYPLPSIHPKKTKRAIAAVTKEEPAVKSSVVVIEEIEEKTTCAPPRAVPLSFIAETVLPTRHGRYRVRAYRQLDDSGNPTDVEIMVIVHGQPELIKHDVPVRIHDACFTSEVIHSLKCDCREQLEYAMKYIRDAKDGVVIYLPQEGRGIGLSNKIKAYAMQELGLDTVDANRALGFPDDNRAYNAVPSILQDLQIQSVRLLSNNTRKFDVMRALGVQINGRLPVLVLPTFVDEHGQSNGIQLTAQVAEGAPEYVKRDTKYAENYVKAKIARMNHMQYAQDI